VVLQWPISAKAYLLSSILIVYHALRHMPQRARVNEKSRFYYPDLNFVQPDAAGAT
jgi:hypothetical protein